MDTHCSPFPAGNTWRLQSAFQAGEQHIRIFISLILNLKALNTDDLFMVFFYFMWSYGYHMLTNEDCYLCELGKSTRVSHLPWEEKTPIKQTANSSITFFASLCSAPDQKCRLVQSVYTLLTFMLYSHYIILYIYDCKFQSLQRWCFTFFIPKIEGITILLRSDIFHICWDDEPRICLCMFTFR